MQGKATKKEERETGKEGGGRERREEREGERERREGGRGEGRRERERREGEVVPPPDKTTHPVIIIYKIPTTVTPQ